MAGRYGMTFAAKLIQEGKYAEAVEEASRAVARDDEDPAALVDRASAYAWLERYPDAVRDLEAALALDQSAGVLELDVVDDAYFSALLGAAKAEALTSIEAAARTLGRYKTVLPDGRHLEDAALWPERLRGASGGRHRDNVARLPPLETMVKVDGRVSRARLLRESRRASVLAVARKIFSQKGYHDTSIDDLIEAAGIARGTFYLYFESKRAIFDELLDSLVTTLQSQVKRIEVGPEAPDPVEQMNATVDKVLKTLVDNREMARILLREAVGIDTDFDRKLSDFYGRIEAMLVGALNTGRKLGVVRACDANVVARCTLGSVKEVVQWAFVEQDPMKIDLQKLGREVITNILKGCLA